MYFPLIFESCWWCIRLNFGSERKMRYEQHTGAFLEVAEWFNDKAVMALTVHVRSCACRRLKCPFQLAAGEATPGKSPTSTPTPEAARFCSARTIQTCFSSKRISSRWDKTGSHALSLTPSEIDSLITAHGILHPCQELVFVVEVKWSLASVQVVSWD